MAGVYTDPGLNLSKLGKAFGRKPRFQTGPGGLRTLGGSLGRMAACRATIKAMRVLIQIVARTPSYRSTASPNFSDGAWALLGSDGTGSEVPATLQTASTRRRNARASRSS